MDYGKEEESVQIWREIGFSCLCGPMGGTGSSTMGMKRFRARNGERTNKHDGKNREPRLHCAAYPWAFT